MWKTCLSTTAGTNSTASTEMNSSLSQCTNQVTVSPNNCSYEAPKSSDTSTKTEQAIQVGNFRVFVIAVIQIFLIFHVQIIQIFLFQLRTKIGTNTKTIAETAF